jgi:hypothetical protein
MKIKTKRYTFIFKGKGNYDRRGVRHVLIHSGMKAVNRVFNIKTTNKYIEKINNKLK